MNYLVHIHCAGSNHEMENTQFYSYFPWSSFLFPGGIFISVGSASHITLLYSTNQSYKKGQAEANGVFVI